MLKLAILTILFQFLPFAAIAGELPPYAVAETAVPVMNTPDFPALFGGEDGRTLRLDRCGQMRELEFIALPQTPFRILESLEVGGRRVYRVTTEEYPCPSRRGCFVDGRFVRTTAVMPVERQRKLPPRQEIMKRLVSAAGTPYVWGGNLRGGVPRLTEMFPPATKDPALLRRWTLQGLDCSGLLYEATGGWTPRNTGQLITYGKGVPVAGLGARRISALLKPLDLIVWDGHVIIVLDGGRSIESRLQCGGPGNGGIVIEPLQETLSRVMRTRRPVNAYADKEGGGNRRFVVRRWYEGL